MSLQLVIFESCFLMISLHFSKCLNVFFVFFFYSTRDSYILRLTLPAVFQVSGFNKSLCQTRVAVDNGRNGSSAFPALGTSTQLLFHLPPIPLESCCSEVVPGAALGVASDLGLVLTISAQMSSCWNPSTSETSCVGLSVPCRYGDAHVPLLKCWTFSGRSGWFNSSIIHLLCRFSSASLVN